MSFSSFTTQPGPKVTDKQTQPEENQSLLRSCLGLIPDFIGLKGGFSEQMAQAAKLGKGLIFPLWGSWSHAQHTIVHGTRVAFTSDVLNLDIRYGSWI